jgi:hypothetical protein
MYQAIRLDKTLYYLCATGCYEFWRKNEVAVNQRQFNVKFRSFKKLLTEYFWAPSFISKFKSLML